jgi:ATP-dependent DNA ligase
LPYHRAGAKLEPHRRPAAIGPLRTTALIEPCPTDIHARRAGPAWAREIRHDCRRACGVALHISHGEAVLCDPATGISDFDALRLALAQREGSPAAIPFALDLLALDGQDLRAEPWQVRRETLASLLRGSKRNGGLRLSEHLEGDGAAMYRHACKLALKGIVSKRRDSAYKSGRSPHWLKIKNPKSPAAKRIAEIEW